MHQYQPRIIAFLLFGFGGMPAGVILNAMPLRIPTVGWAFFLGWWIAAAIGSALLPRGYWEEIVPALLLIAGKDEGTTSVLTRNSKH